MSREIKFRAWDINAEEMVLWERLLMTRYGKEWDNIFNDPDHKLMQYTGLLDKNGKKIYEGDVVRVTFANGTRMKGVVEFNDGCFDIRFKVTIGKHGKNRDYLKCFTCNHAVKVIGNIYGE